MRTSTPFLALCFALLSTTAWAGGGEHRRHHGDSSESRVHPRDHGPSVFEEIAELELRSRNLHDEMDRQLAILDRQLESRYDWRSDREIRRTVQRVRELRRSLASIDARLAEVARFASAPPRIEEPCAMSAQAFTALLSAIDHEHFDDSRLAVLRSAAHGASFTVDQVRAVMGRFTFGDGKIEAADLMYDRTLDRERWFTLYAELTFSSEKDELRRRTS